MLAVSCTYQWQADKVERWEETRNDISDYFRVGWQKLFAGDLELKIRRNERHSLVFMSHTLVLKKDAKI